MRPSLAAAALLLAATASAAPIRDSPTPKEHDGLVAAWLKALDTLDSGKDLAAELRREPVTFVLGERVGAYGRYEDGRVYLNGPTLTGDIDDALEKGASPAAAVEKAAWLNLPAFAHEVEHARTRRMLARVAGAPYGFPDRDDELLSMAREMRVAKEVERVRPGLLPRGKLLDRDKVNSALLAMGPGDLDKLDSIVDATYRTARRLRLQTSEETRAWARRSLDESDAGLAELRRDRGDSRSDYYRERIEQKESYRAKYQELADLAEDKKRFDAVKAYFIGRHARLVADFPAWAR